MVSYISLAMMLTLHILLCCYFGTLSSKYYFACWHIKTVVMTTTDRRPVIPSNSECNKLNYGCAPKRAYIQILYLRLIAKACILGLCQRLIFKTYILGLYSNPKCLFPSDISGAEPQVRLYVRTSVFNLGRVQISYFCTKHLTIWV